MGAIQVEFSDGRPASTSLDTARDALAPLGAGIWPLDLSDVPPDVTDLIARPTLADDDVARLKESLLLPRERLLAILADAGREPSVPGGGALETYVVSHGYGYPQLYVVEPGIDYSRFDRFHVNTAEDGTGVDEVAQLLWGGVLEVVQRLPRDVVLTIRVKCEAPGCGFIVTYDGGLPHMGRLSTAAPGTKLLVQVFGPPEWSIHYVDD